MQQQLTIVSAETVSRLKKQAKRLQRKSGRPHHELLDEVARGIGMPDWHHLTEHHKGTLELERPMRTGLVIMIDISEGIDLQGDAFVDASEVFGLRYEEIMAWMRRNPDNRNEAEEPLREFIEVTYRFLRYTSGEALPEQAGLLRWLAKHTFFPPDLVWLRGRMIDIDALAAAATRTDDDAGPDEPMPRLPEVQLRQAFGETHGATLILNSPDTMERYAVVEGRRLAWHWCLHCERAYPQGSYRQDGELQMCPYAGCDGDTIMDLWPWTRVRESNQTYPAVPALGIVYPLYGNAV